MLIFLSGNKGLEFVSSPGKSQVSISTDDAPWAEWEWKDILTAFT